MRVQCTVVECMVGGLRRTQSLDICMRKSHTGTGLVNASASLRIDKNAPFGIATGGDWQAVLDVQLVVELHDVSMFPICFRLFASLKVTFCWRCMLWGVHFRLCAD